MSLSVADFPCNKLICADGRGNGHSRAIQSEMLGKTMKTKAANDFAEAILQKAKQFEVQATTNAVCYAQSDNKSDQEAFKRYTEKAELFRQLHREACLALHAIEEEAMALAVPPFAAD
jgi:DNA topoisomerase VI subunit B